MLHRPAFRPEYSVQVVPPDGVFLLAETGHELLRGEVYCRVARQINGRRTADELVDLLEGALPATHVYYALLMLERGGYLVEAAEAWPRDAAAFCSVVAGGARGAKKKLGAARVSLASYGRKSQKRADALAKALAALGIRVVGAKKAADLTVALVDDYLRDELGALNARMLATDRPWLPVKPVGTVLWIGPLFRPGQTGCWACLAQRLRANRPVEAFVARTKGLRLPIAPARAALPTSLALAAQLAATEVARAVLGGPPQPLEGRLLTFNLKSLETQSHVLVRRPQCPACGRPGDLSGQEPAPLALESRPKAAVRDGGHRGRTPEETLREYGHHVSPITGAVPYLKRASGETDTVIHAYSAGLNFAYPGGELAEFQTYLRAKSAGKGMSDAQARASGLCEALERYSGLFQGDEPRRSAAYADLASAAIHPETCLHFSKAQYAERAVWNGRALPIHRVPEPFDEDRSIEWTPLWSLTHETIRYLPAALCYYGYVGPGAEYCSADSNGNAAGNSLEEAILQGLLELVERDAIALWWYNRLRRPAIDLAEWDVPYFQELQAAYRRRGRDLWVLDLTTDLGIPVAAAITRRCALKDEMILFGFGAHLDPEVAIGRALTEANQLLTWAGTIDLSANEDLADPANPIGRWLRAATVDNQPYLAPDPGQPPKRRRDYLTVWNNDLREDVRTCQRIVERQGLELLVLDQTRPDIALPVVKTVVPGLRHFWPRLAAGRLYDVPVQLGWQAAPLPESALNPIPFFI
jgi:ribosomal protein S12 methylthiotransferase accessory factor